MEMFMKKLLIISLALAVSGLPVFAGGKREAENRKTFKIGLAREALRPLP
jgi:hypothetical protein